MLTTASFEGNSGFGMMAWSVPPLSLTLPLTLLEFAYWRAVGGERRVRPGSAVEDCELEVEWQLPAAESGLARAVPPM